MQPFSYEDHVRAVVFTLHISHLVLSVCLACLKVYEAGASIVFAKNYYVR